MRALITYYATVFAIGAAMVARTFAIGDGNGI